MGFRESINRMTNKNGGPGLLKGLVHYSVQRPGVLVRIDGTGAMLSLFMLLIVLPRFKEMFGLPEQMLSILAFVAGGIVLFNGYCQVFRQGHAGGCLRVLLVVNSLYLLLTIVLAFVNAASIQALWWTYLILEGLVLLVLAYVELQVIRLRK